VEIEVRQKTEEHLGGGTHMMQQDLIDVGAVELPQVEGQDSAPGVDVSQVNQLSRIVTYSMTFVFDFCNP
jgi:hypothetical protein